MSLHLVSNVDAAASAIGDLYRRGKSSMADSMRYLAEAGQRLAEKKSQLQHGEWLPWLEANAEVLGFDAPQTAQKLMAVARKYRVDAVYGETEALAASRLLWGNVRREELEERKAAREIPPADMPDACDRYRLLLSDLATTDIEANSVDCIITDPPYPAEFVELYAVLAERASLWLKPGGSLVAMAGHMHLPEVLAALSSGGLSYHWTAAYLTPGGQAHQNFPRRVNTFWKPVFWFVKGTYSGEWIGDVFRSDVNDNDKRFHEWGQSESGFADLLKKFTKAGDVVCDPFMGGGTTGIVALAMNRYFIGVEKDPETFGIAKRRIVGGQDAALVI